MTTPVTLGKDKSVSSVGYNKLMAIPFASVSANSNATTAVPVRRIPLGLNLKIMAVSYAGSQATTSGTAAINIVLGGAVYEGVGSAPFATLTLGGTYAINDTITVVVGGISFSFQVTSRTAGNNPLIAASIASAINKQQPFAVQYFCSYQGPILILTLVAYGTAGNSTTFTASRVTTASGTVTASGSTLAGGTGSATATPGVGTATVGGTWLMGDTATTDTYSVNGGNHNVVYTVPSTGLTTAQIAAGIAAAVNADSTAAVLVTASSSGSNVIFTTKPGQGYQPNYFNFSASHTSASGSYNGTGQFYAVPSDYLPTMPALDNSNFTSPPQVAAAGTALFPVDIPVLSNAESSGIAYPVVPENYEAIWPAGSELTLRVFTSSNFSTVLDIILWCVPYDVHPMSPQDHVQYFVPGPQTL